MSKFGFSGDSSGFGASRITWAVQRLLLLNIVIFALQLVVDPIMTVAGYGAGMPPGSLNPWLGFQPDKFVAGWIWLPFSYQFLHGGLMHLVGNMVGLYFFGPDVERILGTRSFFRFYIICGAGAVLATLLPFFLTGKDPVVVGASGAVMGVLVAFAMAEPDRQVFLFPWPFPINARALVIIFFVMNVIYSRTGAGVAWETHLGGMAMGFLYMKGVPLFLDFQRQRRKDSRKKDGKDDKVGEAVDNIFDFNDRKRH